ncbi:MAG: hypothetical protein ACLGJB_03645 [Blastocatellia bacterium]
MNWKEQFDKSEVAERINIVESIAQIHGIPPYHGPTIQDFISTEIIEKLIADIPDVIEDILHNKAMTIELKQQLRDKWL